MWFPSCRSLQTLKPWSRGFITFRLSGWRPISSLKSKSLYALLHIVTVISSRDQFSWFPDTETCYHTAHSLFDVFAASRGHEAYLRTGPHYDFDHYRQLVHEITQAFVGISNEVLQIKGKLHHDFDRPDLSEHIEKLQSKEKQKLELVCKPSLCIFYMEATRFQFHKECFYNQKMCICCSKLVKR